MDLLWADDPICLPCQQWGYAWTKWKVSKTKAEMKVDGAPDHWPAQTAGDTPVWGMVLKLCMADMGANGANEIRKYSITKL